MAASRFVKVTDTEIREIKINSVPKNTKVLSKTTKTIIRLGSVIIGEYLFNEFIEQSTYVLYEVQSDKRKTKHASQITN